MKTTSILGCGWLGFPLGVHLLEKGYKVKGSTTRKERLQEIADQGIEAHQIIANPELEGKTIPEFFNSDILILNIPPRRKQENIEQFHPEQIQSVMEHVKKSPIQKLIFIGSTGVYGNVNRVVTEDDIPVPERASGKALWQVEQYLRGLDFIETTIVRMSGLAGADRKAGRFLAGKKDLPNGNAPVNLVHLDDCIPIISQVIEQEKWGETYNIAADLHPTRSELYTFLAKKQGFETPTFLPNARASYKIISNQKVKEDLGYEFIYPDPMEF